MLKQFPKNFIWGIGVSSHQHEGSNTHSDWWHWEQSHSNLKKSGRAVDHWNLFEEDLQCVVDLGLSHYRFNIEWARLFPREGELDQAVLSQYRQRLATVKKLGLRPFISLQHMTWPQWLSESGGVLRDDFPDLFADYARICGEQIAPGCQWWTTAVDWSAHLLLGYCSPVLPPGKSRPWLFPKALKNFLLGHARAYTVLKSQDSHRMVGLVHFIQLFDAGSGWHNRLLAKKVDELFNWTALNAFSTGHIDVSLFPFFLCKQEVPELKSKIDFVGLNYYSRCKVDLHPLRGELLKQAASIMVGDPKDANRTDMGWEIYPQGMYRVMMHIKQQYDLPIVITEHGLADSNDTKRPSYIVDYLAQAHRAMIDGVDLRGCFHWSLTDNFEWLEGFGPRFGVYSIDYDTLERTERTKSANIIRSLARNNGLQYSEIDKILGQD